ncbi:MAG: hypothetical protein ACLP7Q_10665 [Isosphaeraceae bacterium]
MRIIGDTESCVPKDAAQGPIPARDSQQIHTVERTIGSALHPVCQVYIIQRGDCVKGNTRFDHFIGDQNVVLDVQEVIILINIIEHTFNARVDDVLWLANLSEVEIDRNQREIREPTDTNLHVEGQRTNSG